MEIRILRLNLFKKLSLLDFEKKYFLKDDTMTETVLKNAYIFPFYPRVSNIYTSRGFVYIYIDSGEQGGFHWTCFYMRDNKSFYFVSFGRQPDKYSPKQLPKLITFPSYKLQHTDNKLCGVYCS